MKKDLFLKALYLRLLPLSHLCWWIYLSCQSQIKDTTTKTRTRLYAEFFVQISTRRLAKIRDWMIKNLQFHNTSLILKDYLPGSFWMEQRDFLDILLRNKRTRISLLRSSTFRLLIYRLFLAIELDYTWNVVPIKEELLVLQLWIPLILFRGEQFDLSITSIFWQKFQA